MCLYDEYNNLILLQIDIPLKNFNVNCSRKICTTRWDDLYLINLQQKFNITFNFQHNSF